MLVEYVRPGAVVGLATGAVDAALVAAPQLEQNFDPWGSAAPHCMQKFPAM
ncbi:MAG: hypothetical protein WC138_13020 [Methanoculleus sp.]|jgi:hypothetical protein